MLEQVILAPHAVKRLIEPEEVAGVIAFLAGRSGARLHRRTGHDGPRMERPVDLPAPPGRAARARGPRLRSRGRAARRCRRCAASWTPSSASRPGARWTRAAPTARSPARSASPARPPTAATASSPPRPSRRPARASRPGCASRPRPAPPSSSRARRRPRSAPPGWAPSTCCSASCARATRSPRPRCAPPASRSRTPAWPPSRRWPGEEPPEDRASQVTAYARRVFTDALREAAASTRAT